MTDLTLQSPGEGDVTRQESITYRDRNSSNVRLEGDTAVPYARVVLNGKIGSTKAGSDMHRDYALGARLP